MSIKVGCQCGQRFSAPDSLAGKRVKCPQCASPIQIPGAKSQQQTTGSSSRAASQPVASGDDIFGMDDLSGLEGHHDPLGLGAQTSAPQAMGGHSPYVHHGMHANRYANAAAASKGTSNGLWIGLAAGGGALVVLVIVAAVVGAMMIGNNDSPEVSQSDVDVQRPTSSQVRVDQTSNGRGAGQSAGTPKSSSNGGGPVGPNSNGSSEAGSEGEVENTTPVSTDGGGAEESPQLAPVKSLARTTPAWLYDTSAPKAGTRKVDDQQLVILYYSWMVDLLPHLGHQQVYDRFNLEKSWMEPENQRVCHELIPQYLNPLDDRQRLDDPRFPAFAVTHFAGMSGVEELPNDRAAEWARAHPAAGVFGYHDMARAKDISDGTSNTIMIVGTGRIVEPWAIGGGATVRGAREPLFGKFNGLGSIGLPKPGVIVVMADGSIRHITDDIDPDVFKAMCTIHGAEQVDLKAAGISPAQQDWFVP